jgi:hypothetical protein
MFEVMRKLFSTVWAEDLPSFQQPTNQSVRKTIWGYLWNTYFGNRNAIFYIGRERRDRVERFMSI